MRFSSVREMTLHQAVRIVAESDDVPCLCSQSPYEDGELCPKCFCIFALDVESTE